MDHNIVIVVCLLVAIGAFLELILRRFGTIKWARLNIRGLLNFEAHGEDPKHAPKLEEGHVESIHPDAEEDPRRDVNAGAS